MGIHLNLIDADVKLSFRLDWCMCKLLLTHANLTEADANSESEL